MLKDIVPSCTFGIQSATAKRGVHSCKKTFKNPLVCVPEIVTFASHTRGTGALSQNHSYKPSLSLENLQDTKEYLNQRGT